MGRYGLKENLATIGHHAFDYVNLWFYVYAPSCVNISRKQRSALGEAGSISIMNSLSIH